MNIKIAATAAACTLAFSSAPFSQAPAKPAAAPASAAAPAAAAAAAPPAWKQGMGDKYKDSTLAPNAAKNTETPVSEIPLDKFKVPKGFKLEVWASGITYVTPTKAGCSGPWQSTCSAAKWWGGAFART